MTILEVLTQFMLPIVLACMMFAMGLSLTVNDFRRIARYPLAAMVGIALQLLLLPMIAWALIFIITLFIPLSPALSSLLFLGLVILAACPGGATSNVISYLAGGDAALSISMTAVVSLLVPFLIPISLSYQFVWLGNEAVALQLPFIKTVMQLLLVTVLPVILAMVIRHYWTQSIIKWEPFIAKLIGGIFVCLIVTLVVMQWSMLVEMGIWVALLCLSLCLVSMLSAYVISRMMGFDLSIQKTLAIEVGFQNAGTGMFIAAVLLKDPGLAIVPLIYGLVMNLPALVLVAVHRNNRG
jgi:BASS family bile acid:Na+ symporter